MGFFLNWLQLTFHAKRVTVEIPIWERDENGTQLVKRNKQL